MRRHGKETLPIAFLSHCRRWSRLIRDRLLRFVGLGVSVGRAVPRRPSVKLNLESLEAISLPNNLLALLPLGALLADFTPANIALVPAATDRVFDEPTGASAGLSGLTPTAQVVSAQPLAIPQPGPTVIALATSPAASPLPADLAFQSGFPDQAAGLMSSAAFNSLLDSAAAFPVAPAATPAPQPAGAAPASSASPAASSAAPTPFSSAAPLAAPATTSPAVDAAPAGPAADGPSPQGGSQQTNISVSTTANPTVQYQTIAFTVAVGGSGPAPTGNVTLMDGGVAISQAISLPPSQSNTTQVNISVSFATIGTHNITALYSGDSTYATETSSPWIETVNPGQPPPGPSATTTTLTSSANPATPNYPVTFTANVASNGGAAPGTVTFRDGGVVLGTVTLDQFESASLTTSFAVIGSHSITATYNGATYFLTSSASLTQTVAVEQTTTTLTASVNPSLTNNGVTFTTHVVGQFGITPTGSVTFTFDNHTWSTPLTTFSPGNAVASFAYAFPAPGNYPITAVYNPDPSFAVSSATLTQTVQNEPTTTSLASNFNPSYPNAAVIFTAKVVGQFGDAPTGTVDFYLNNALLDANVALAPGGANYQTAAVWYAFPALGSYTISAVYNPAANTPFTASSTAMTQVVQKPTTTTSLTSNVNPSTTGQGVAFTAQIVGQDGGTPTGTITFTDNGNVVATVPLTANTGGAAASFATSYSTPAIHTISASYAGDATYSGSNGALNQTVQAPTATSLTSSLNPSPVTRPVTFTAEVTDAFGVTPTGTVTFKDGTTVVDTETLTADAGGAHATFITSGLALGNHSITAVYTGATLLIASTSAPVTQTVVLLTTATALSSSVNPSPVTRNLTFTAQVVGQFGETPTGTVKFLDGTTVVDTETLAGGAATFTTSNLALGHHSITAKYFGDSTHDVSMSAALDQSIVLLTTHTSLVSSVNPSAFVQTVTFTAEVDGQFGETPTGTVTFTDNGTTLGQPVTLAPGGAGAVATFTTSNLALGGHPITVSYSGDSTHDVSGAGPLTQTVNQATTTTTLTTSVTPSLTGQAVTFSVQVVGQYGGTPTGTVKFFDVNTLLDTEYLTAASGGLATFTTSALTLGDHVITAVYSGDANFVNSSSAALTQQVRTPTTTTVTSLLNPTSALQTVVLTAEVDGQTGGPPTGNVTFYDNGAVVDTETLAAFGLNARATFTSSTLAIGAHVITTSYAGDGTFHSSNSSSMTQTVNKAPTTAVVTTSANPTTNQSITLTAQINTQFGGTPTGTVTFMDGSTNLGTATLSPDALGAQATFTTANLAFGDHSITAVYGGDTTFLGSTSAALTQTVQETTQLTIGSNLNPSLVGQSVTFIVMVGLPPYGAGASVTGVVTFLDGATPLTTELLTVNNQSSSATFTTSFATPGLHAVTAQYAGQGIFAASSATWNQTVNQTLAPPVFTGVSPDAGSSNSDQVTNTGLLQILGTASPNAVVSLSELFVGVIDTVTADSTGHWVSNYFNRPSSPLAEGKTYFTATQTPPGSPTSASTAPWPVTVDLTPPTVTLNAPASTASINPQLTATAWDLNGLATPAAVTVQVYDAAGATLLYTSPAINLTDGAATFTLAYALTPGTSYVLKAQATDLAGNVGTSTAAPLAVINSIWSVNSTQSLTSDPLQGDAQLQLGNVRRQHALNLGQSSDLALLKVDASASASANQAKAQVDVSLTPLQSPTTPASLVYNSDSVSVRPIIQARLNSANNGALPSQITAILTWNNGTPITFTYSTANSNPGDALTIAAQVPYPVMATGRYTWKLEVIAGSFDQTTNGYTFVVANDNSPFGAGWTFGPTDHLVNIPADTVNNLPAGILRVYGNGGYRFYSGASLSSPANDNGALTTSSGGHVYTDAGGARKTFDASGNQTSTVSADGHRTTLFTYDTFGRLAGVSTPDGGVSVIGYNSSGQVGTIQGPGGRTYGLAYSGADLASVTNPDGGVERYNYDGNHKLQSDTLGGLQSNWNYGADGGESAATWGSATSPSTSSLIPADARGLLSAWSGPATALGTDATGHISNLLLDDAGRPTKEIQADGTFATWTRDPNSGYVTSQTDFLGRTTSFLNDAQGYVTSETLPDGTKLSYVYGDAFHDLTSTTDARGGVTTNAYDAQGNLTSTTAPDGGVTSYGYDANGLMTSTTDPLGNATKYSYDADRRLTSMTDALGHTTTYLYDAAGNLHTTVDALGRTTTNNYDAMGRLIQTVDASGASSSKTYDTAGVELSSTDALGRKSQPTYDGTGRGLATQQSAAVGTPAAASTQTWYDANGRVTKTQDANGKQTQIAYDAKGQVTQTTDANGGVMQTEYDADGRVTKVQDALGRWTSYGYDAAGNQTSVTDALGRTTTMLYNAAGDMISQTDALGRTTTFGYDIMGRQTSVTDPLGHTTTTTYDKAGNVLTVTDPLGRVTAYGYDALNRVTITTEAVGTPLQRSSFVYYDAVGNVSAQTDPLGRTTSFGYDKLDRQISMTDALGHTTTTAYDAAGNAISTTDALGQTTKYGYDALNRQTTATDPLGHTVTTIYDANGQATATIDALGDLNAIQHDGVGQVIGTTDALGRESGAVYDAAGELKSVTDVKGNTTLYGYDAAGQQVSATDALGHTTITVYDAAGQVTSVTDPLGHTTTYHYDAAGRVTSVTDALGHTVAKTYDAADQVLSITDANGNVTQYSYDALGRRTTVTVAVGTPAQATTTIAYDAADQVVSVTDPLGHVTTFYYDAAGRRTAVTDALGHTTTMAYDADGNVISVTDATGAVTQYVYDAANRRIAVTDALGHTTTMAYDAADRPIFVTDALGDVTTTQYDANGRVTATIDALGNKTTMAYDANGNMTSITDADGNTTAFTYDALNRKTVTTNQLGYRTTTTYDAAGRIASITDADGRVRQFAYDAADRVTGETWISSGGATVNQLSYTYDANGNLLTASDNSGTYTNTYDAQNRLVTQTNPLGLTLTYTYDAAGRATQRADSQGGVLNYFYDNADRLISEQFSGTNQTQARVDLAYDDRNELAVLTRYADVTATVLVGTTAYNYDLAGRVTGITNKNASGALVSYYYYGYDNADRVTAESYQSVTATGTLSGSRNYSYDVTNQLTADGSTAFSYDANGNRTMTGYQTGPNNQITNDGVFSYTYDAVGDIIEKSKGTGLETWYYGYDTLNRLTSIRETSDGTTNVYTVAYTYDVMGNRSVEDVWQAGVGETITRTAFDGGQAWADLTSANAVTTRYVWGAGGQELYARIDVGAGLRQVSQDRLGSVRDIWDGSGVSLDHIEYAAYGAINSETAAALGGHYLFTGLLQNRITDTADARGRTLFVDIGKWPQPDPITFSAGDANIARYVGNNPTNLTDPSGLEGDSVYSRPRNESCISGRSTTPSLHINDFHYSFTKVVTRDNNDPLTQIMEAQRRVDAAAAARQAQYYARRRVNPDGEMRARTQEDIDRDERNRQEDERLAWFAEQKIELREAFFGLAMCFGAAAARSGGGPSFAEIDPIELREEFRREFEEQRLEQERLDQRDLEPPNVELQTVRRQIAGQIGEIARRRSLGVDPASGRYRLAEEDAALRLEQQIGRQLRRDPSGTGDWLDADRHTYDAVGPVPSGRFDFASFARQIDRHLLKQGLDHVVVDVSGLSDADRVDVITHIENLPAAQRARIIVQPR